MSLIRTVRGKVISKGITSVISSPNIIKVRNQLLDGTYHVQSIGNPYTTIDLTFEVDPAGKANLDEAYITDTDIELQIDNDYHVGLLESEPTVSAISLSKGFKLYSVDVTLVVHRSGVL